LIVKASEAGASIQSMIEVGDWKERIVRLEVIVRYDAFEIHRRINASAENVVVVREMQVADQALAVILRELCLLRYEEQLVATVVVDVVVLQSIEKIVIKVSYQAVLRRGVCLGLLVYFVEVRLCIRIMIVDALLWDSFRTLHELIITMFHLDSIEMTLIIRIQDAWVSFL
jgi:hypothetical protein